MAKAAEVVPVDLANFGIWAGVIIGGVGAWSRWYDSITSRKKVNNEHEIALKELERGDS